MTNDNRINELAEKFAIHAMLADYQKALHLQTPEQFQATVMNTAQNCFTLAEAFLITEARHAEMRAAMVDKPARKTRGKAEQS